MYTDFQIFFHCSKFVIKLYLNIPPHLKRIATLPCEISMFTNRHVQEVIEANCCVRLSEPKTVFKYLSGKISIV